MNTPSPKPPAPMVIDTITTHSHRPGTPVVHGVKSSALAPSAKAATITTGRRRSIRFTSNSGGVGSVMAKANRPAIKAMVPIPSCRRDQCRGSVLWRAMPEPRSRHCHISPSPASLMQLTAETEWRKPTDLRFDLHSIPNAPRNLSGAGPRTSSTTMMIDPNLGWVDSHFLRQALEGFEFVLLDHFALAVLLVCESSINGYWYRETVRRKIPTVRGLHR